MYFSFSGGLNHFSLSGWKVARGIYKFKGKSERSVTENWYSGISFMSKMFKGQFIRVQFDTLSHSVDLDRPEWWNSHNWRDSYRSHDKDEEKNDAPREAERRLDRQPRH